MLQENQIFHEDAALIPPDFAETGFLAPRAPKTPITRFQVLGERSSGTNFVKRLLGRNSAMKPTEDLGWKHGFPHSVAIPPDLGVVLMVRRADSWALSMHKKPWHTIPAIQELEFQNFIRARWQTVVDRPRYFPGAEALGVVGQPLQHDRNPLTGQTFPNLFALRKAKLYGLLSYLRRPCTCVLLSTETAQMAPEATLDALLEAFDQPQRDGAFQPVQKRLGAKFLAAVDTRPQTPKAMGAHGIRFLRSQLDLRLEAALGYRYDAN